MWIQSGTFGAGDLVLYIIIPRLIMLVQTVPGRFSPRCVRHRGGDVWGRRLIMWIWDVWGGRFRGGGRPSYGLQD